MPIITLGEIESERGKGRIAGADDGEWLDKKEWRPRLESNQ